MITIGQRIRQYRKNIGFTQAFLAEKLGISVQTVSKWETDTGCPDISQILPLAKVLGVTTDSILGMGEDEESEISAAYKKIDEMWSAGYDNQSAERRECDLILEAYETLHLLVRKYPMNYDVKHDCIIQGCWVMYHICKTKFLSIDKCEKNRIFNEILRMINSILEQDNDMGRQVIAKERLVLLYSYMGDYDKAEETVAMLPEIHKISNRARLIMASIKDDQEEWLLLAQNISVATALDLIEDVFLVGKAYSVMGAPMREKAIEIWQYLAGLAESLSPIIGEAKKYSWIKGSYLLLAKEYLRDSDFEKCIDCAEKVCEYNILYYNSLKNPENKGSFLFGKPEEYEADFKELREQFKWDLVGCYDEATDRENNPVVTSPRFQALFKKIEELNREGFVAPNANRKQTAPLGTATYKLFKIQ